MNKVMWMALLAVFIGGVGTSMVPEDWQWVPGVAATLCLFVALGLWVMDL